ncbi:MAG TPA: GNAT family N-acetyltransferase [Acidimicrobiales bacterium]|nr:GNAT family N-acetyltransferase [Acidimicrobiales bacterium]
MTESLEVHLASRDEIPDVAAVLARAFFEDRIYQWLVPDKSQRRRSTERFYAIFAEACWTHASVYIATDAAGVALWIPPGRDVVASDGAEDFGRRLLETAGDDSAATRMAALLEALDAHHPSEPCWHLPFMGVDPPRQGTGLGSALLEAALRRVDTDRCSAYLEASCPESQRLYERHGFETMGEIVVLDAPSLYPMWREPRA